MFVEPAALTPARAPVQLITARRPLSYQTEVALVDAGPTIEELIRGVGIPEWAAVVVYLNGRLLPTEGYARVRPKPGTHVLIRVVPRGGGGGSGKSIGQIIGGLLLIVGGILVGILEPYGLGWTQGIPMITLGAGLLIGGLVGVLVPAPSLRLRPLTGLSGADAESPTLSIAGQSNQVRPYAVCPRVLGRHRIWPPYAALPFTELLGSDQYLRLLFFVSLGETDTEDYRIGETPIANFSDVQMEVRTGAVGESPITLYTNTVIEVVPGTLLTSLNRIVRTSETEAITLSVDIAFPNGLVSFLPSGQKAPRQVEVIVEYRPVGTVDWLPVWSLAPMEAKQSMVRVGVAWAVSPGQYDVSLTRITPDNIDPQTLDVTVWSALRTFRATAPINLPAGVPYAVIAMRIKATDQLNGVLTDFNCIATSRLPDWDGASWTVRQTSNPASHYRHILQSAENARPVADARLDLPELQAWHEECATGERSCNLVVDYKTTVQELLQIVAATGRATPTSNDGKFATVRDLLQTVPRQHFTPRNTRNWRGSRAIRDEVHAIKVHFTDATNNWMPQAERIVYDDLYSATGTEPGKLPATKFEVLEFHGVTDPAWAWRLGRYYLAVLKLRSELVEFETDIEHLRVRRGDLVQVAHDVIEGGISWGRIKAIDAESMTADESMPMLGGHFYGVRIREQNGDSRLATVRTFAGENVTVAFATPLETPLPHVGDLFLFGELGVESTAMLVNRITPGPNHTARLVTTPAEFAVLNADTGPIPAWEPVMTPRPSFVRQPPTPIILSVASDETVLLRALDGSLTTRIVVTLDYRATSNLAADYVEGRWRRTGSALPFEVLPPQPPETPTISFTDVEDGTAYDLRVRTVNRQGPASEWAEVLGYVVIGKSTPPAAPINLRREGTTIPQLAWDYPNPPPDFAGFEVRRSAGTVGNWETALELHVGLVFSPFILGAIYGEWTLLVAAIDTSGNASEPITLTDDFGGPEIHNQVASVNYHPTFPGTLVNGTLVGGQLKADQLTTGFWTNNANRFWSPSGTTLFWQGTYKEMSYTFAVTPDATTAGTTIVFSALTVVATAWRLYYRLGATGDFLAWAGSLPDVIEGQEYQFKLVTDAGVVQGIVSAITLVFDALDLDELHSNFATAASTGTRLTLQKVYRSLTVVAAQVINFGAETAQTVVVVDRQNVAGAANGPLLQCFSSSVGAGVVAGHCDVIVRGY